MSACTVYRQRAIRKKVLNPSTTHVPSPDSLQAIQVCKQPQFASSKDWQRAPLFSCSHPVAPLCFAGMTDCRPTHAAQPTPTAQKLTTCTGATRTCTIWSERVAVSCFAAARSSLAWLAMSARELAWAFSWRTCDAKVREFDRDLDRAIKRERAPQYKNDWFVTLKLYHPLRSWHEFRGKQGAIVALLTHVEDPCPENLSEQPPGALRKDLADLLAFCPQNTHLNYWITHHVKTRCEEQTLMFDRVPNKSVHGKSLPPCRALTFVNFHARKRQRRRGKHASYLLEENIP
eukprot:scaffold70194_cov19-Tisochrysis_lutea.AAC.2